MRPKLMSSFLLLPCVVVMAACAASTEKGPEDNELIDGKADSFYRPTYHGTLGWGIPARATLTADEQFHAWTFELSEESSFVVSTDSELALDTVMYLYHRDDPDASWGSYVAKNDDASPDEVTSRIERDGAPAGEYRVIVKGYKAAYRGEFSIVGTCDGAGCSGGASCDPATFPDFADGVGYSASCAAPFLAVLQSPVVARNDQEVTLEDKCALAPLAASTVDLYQAYWDDVVGWDEWSDLGVSEPLLFEVTTTTHEEGTVVSVTMPVYDEDRIVAAYDSEGALLVFYVDGQSPDVRWYCGDSSEALDAEGPSCTIDLFGALPHEEGEASSDSGTTTYADAYSDLDPVLELSIGEFVYGFGFDEDTSVAYEASSWRNADTGLLGGRITYTVEDVEATYTMMTTYRDHTLVGAVTTDSGTEITCLELM